jgi:hypothetical protein
MDTTSDMQRMELIEMIMDEHEIAREDVMVRAIKGIIDYTRELNMWGAKDVSHPLPGTNYLHGMLKEKIISNDLYIQLVRLAEDPTMEYEIKIITE